MPAAASQRPGRGPGGGPERELAPLPPAPELRPRPGRELALRLPSPVQELADDRLLARGIRLLLKRDDLIHPDLPGNKWRKLGPTWPRPGRPGTAGC